MTAPQGPGLSMSSGIGALAMVLGIWYLQPPELKPTRPVPEPALTHQRYESRLWEDPFAAVKRAQDKGLQAVALNELVEEIGTTRGPEVNVLVVSCPGGGFAEDGERRRRNRYAVAAALHSRGYAPRDSTRLDFINLGEEDKLGSYEVPYEWFDATEPDRPSVLILWFDDSSFTDRSVFKFWNKRIGDFKADERCQADARDASCGKQLNFTLLGPSSSTVYAKALSAAPPTEKVRLRVLSWAATSPGSSLLQEVRDFKIKVSHNGGAGHTVIYRDPESYTSYLAQAGGQIVRTIARDKELVDKLEEELDRRGAGRRLAIVSEFDTPYGRILPALFEKRFEKSGRNVRHFAYLRGLDGLAEGQGAAAKNSDKKAGPGSSASIGRTGPEQTFGPSQLDFLRRLVGDIERADAEDEPITAIGVLGSDVYDKLLVLQALRDRFPGKIFFTTDLDLRLADADELPYTRNLVVASSFGTALHPKLQRDLPPFRDNYQTSLYFSALLALDERKVGIDHDTLKKWMQPRIFEIGRNGPVDLSVNGAPPLVCLGMLAAEQGCIEGIHPPTGLWSEAQLKIALPLRALLGLLGLAGLLLFVYARLARNHRAGRVFALGTGVVLVDAVAAHGMLIQPQASSAGWGLFFIGLGLATWALIAFLSHRAPARAPGLPLAVLLSFALFLCLLTVIATQGEEGEPFTLVDGVSIWPTQFIRLFAAILGAALVYKGLRDIRKRARAIAGGCVHLPYDLLKTEPCERAWGRYNTAHEIREHWRRGLFVCFLYLLLCGAVIYAFGFPSIPYRGTASLYANHLVMALVLIVLSALIVSTGYATRTLINLIEEFRAGLHLLSGQPVQLWEAVDVVARQSEPVARLIYYPIVVIILMLVSRVNYLDQWDFPPGLAAVVATSAGYVFWQAIRLRQAAEGLRGEALRDLQFRRLATSDDRLAQALGKVAAGIEAARTGAYVSLMHQPWVQALTLLFGGGGSVALLEAFVLGH